MSNFVFKRQELKYLLSQEEFDAIYPLILEHLKEDKYGLTTIQSLYFDTPTNRLVRNSIDKPKYKEKIRLRGYNLIEPNQKVYLELKKKSKKIVFKRRIQITEDEAMNFVLNGVNPIDNQISKEIEYFISFYGKLVPNYLILYDRVALYEDNSNLRVTFDHNIRYRLDDLNLHTSLEGTPIEEIKGKIIMEIKSDTAMPMWLARILSTHQLYKRSFSKYGTAYVHENLDKMNINKEDINLG